MGRYDVGNPRIYGQELARIHIDGYGFHWQGAAPGVLGMLRGSGIQHGTVVDLGCGGGEWLQLLAHEGYDVCGVDLSPHMLREAKRMVPTGTFIAGSMAEVELPPCDAVTSLGEPINYLDGKKSIRRVIQSVYKSLRPGGLFVFDARHPSAGQVASRTATRVSEDWACIAVIEEKGNTIVRDITWFYKSGKLYRRGFETHRLKVYSKVEMTQWLREAGFRVRTYRGYGDFRFPQRQMAYVARKPV